MWRISSAERARTVTMPDGRQLAIRQLTYGTQHRFLYGNVWARLAAPMLPDSWKAKAGLQTFFHGTTTPALVIWGDWRLPRNAPGPAQMALISEAGSDRPASESGVWMGVPASNHLIMAWVFQNFPRRARSLRVQMCDWDSKSQLKPAATFTLASPVRHTFTTWKAERYPLLRPVKGLQFCMLNFSPGGFLRDPWPLLFTGSSIVSGHVAVFQVKQDRRALDNWHVEAMTVTDATGNVVKGKLQPFVSVGGYIVFGLNDTLWLTEKSWQFRTQFARDGGFASNELCTIRGLPAITSGSVTQLVTNIEVNGVSIGGVEMQAKGRGPSPYRLHEDLEVQPILTQTAGERLVTLVGATDNQGRQLQHDRSYYNLDGHHFGIEPLPDSKSLDLTFAVQAPVTVEFVGGMTRIVLSH